MGACDNWKRIVSIAHGADTLDQPVGGNVRADVEFIFNSPGTSVTPDCAAIDRFRLTGFAKFQGMQTPVVLGTSDTLTYTLQSFDGTNGSLALATMIAGAPGWDFDSAPFSQSQEFVYAGVSQAPWTVTP